MIALLGVTVAVGLTALVLLLLYVRRGAAVADGWSRSERLETELAAAAERLSMAEGRIEEETRRRAQAAEAAESLEVALRESQIEAGEAKRRAEDVLGRADDAEQSLEAANRRAEEAEKRAARAQGRRKKAGDAKGGESATSEPMGSERGTTSGNAPVADVADALWELERLRLEREWQAIGGLTMPMPAGWDGGEGTDLSAAVAVELEVIREVVGTPGRIASPTAPITADPATAIIVTRLAGELLRKLARGGLELNVRLEADDELAVTVATGAQEMAEDLAPLATAASRAGGRLNVEPLEDGVRVEVRLPR